MQLACMDILYKTLCNIADGKKEYVLKPMKRFNVSCQQHVRQSELL